MALALGALTLGGWAPPSIATPPPPDQAGPHAGDAGERAGGHGFVRDTDGRFETIDLPGATTTVVAGSDDRGRIVGMIR